MNCQSYFKYLFIIFLFINQPIHSQIKIPDKNKSSSIDPDLILLNPTVISAIKESNIDIQILFYEPDKYVIKFQCLEVECMTGLFKGHTYIRFRDLDDDFNTLKNVVLNGFTNTPYAPITLEVPDGAIVLTYRKSQYNTKVKIGYKSFDVFKRAKYGKVHYTDWLDKNQIIYLFTK